MYVISNKFKTINQAKIFHKEPPRSDFAAYPRGRGQCPRAFPPSDAGGTGPLAPGTCVDRGGLSSVRPDRAAPSGRGSGPRKGCSRSAARSATHPTRLETRTKESNARASQRVSSSPHGAMKVKAGARRFRWDPPSPEGGGRTTGPSRPQRRAGGARARAMVPERWWTMPGQGEARGNSGGGPQRSWRANRSSDLGIGAKD